MNGVLNRVMPLELVNDKQKIEISVTSVGTLGESSWNPS